MRAGAMACMINPVIPPPKWGNDILAFAILALNAVRVAMSAHEALRPTLPSKSLAVAMKCGFSSSGIHSLNDISSLITTPSMTTSGSYDG